MCVEYIYLKPPLICNTPFVEEDRVLQKLTVPTLQMRHSAAGLLKVLWDILNPCVSLDDTTNTNCLSLTQIQVAGSHCLRQCPALTSCTFLEAGLGVVGLWASLWNLKKLNFEWIHCSSCFLKRKPKKTGKVLSDRITPVTQYMHVTKGSIFL